MSQNIEVAATNRNNRARFKKLVAFSLLALTLTLSAIFLVRKGAEAVITISGQKQTQQLPNGPELFPLACSLLPEAKEDSGVLTAYTPDGTQLRYSIDSALQKEVDRYLSSNRPAYALFIAMEPSSGRILGFATSSKDPDWGTNAVYRTYPMASLFKMITAASALELNKITPSTEMAYRGKAISENAQNWDPRPKGGSRSIDMTDAMGKSVNPVYGKLASDILGKNALAATCNNFGFNRPLVPGIPAIPSRAALPDSRIGLRISGSGLDHELKVSPLHAASITAAFANNGVMMTPRIVDSASKDGKEAAIAPPGALMQVVQPKVAEDLTRMMLTTVTTGTSRKAFGTTDGRRLLSVMKVAAKTGTINGNDPAGQHTWFAAYAPAAKPRIAVLALVINEGKWRIKASNVGEHALTTFFRDELAKAPAVSPVARKKAIVARKTNSAKNRHSLTARKKNLRSSRPRKEV